MTVEKATMDDNARAEALLALWMADKMGCDNIHLERLPRWRPLWRARAVQNGAAVEFLIRAERLWPTHPYSLEYEAAMQEVVHASGVPIPAIRSMCPDPKAIIMDWIPGDRDPNLVQDSIENPVYEDPDKTQAAERYMQVLARLHSLDPATFVTAGARLPCNAVELAISHVECFHAMAADRGHRTPIAEFCMQWLRRNAPDRSPVAFLTGDSGQFLSDGPNLTCIIDIETGHLGDPMRDLACMRVRNLVERFGDIKKLFACYEDAAGRPNDRPVLAYHTVSFMTEAIYGPLIGLSETGEGGNWIEALFQLVFVSKMAMAALAEIIGVPLEPIELPPPHPTPIEDSAIAKLCADIGRLEATNSFQPWHRDLMLSIPTYLQRRGHYRTWLEQAFLADVKMLTGDQSADAAEADLALMRLIATAGPEHDAELTRLFYRKSLREALVIAGPGAGPQHLLLAPLPPIL